jgi:ubiquinone/menaquinone biosynthesis C-methylase UbiE
LGHELTPTAMVLDYGCGQGDMVNAYRQAGFDTWGCDILLKKEGDFVREINADGKIPFPDKTFDFVFSDQVLEHVQDHKTAISEIHRVLKPGAISLHIFPAKLKPTEAHVHVPLAGLIQSYPWLWLWAFLGVRNSFQRGMNVRETARDNVKYLERKTRYLSTAEIRELFATHFGNLTFAEQYMIKHSYGGARHIYPLLKFVPLVASLYSTFYTRVIFCQRTS